MQSTALPDEELQEQAFLDQLAALSAEEVEFNIKEADRADKARQMEEWGFDKKIIESTLDVATDSTLETAEEVEECWCNAIAHTGVVKPSRVGYSFGLNYVPDWGEHTVSLRPGDKTVLEPGMTLHFMPGIWLETYGFECSEPLLVTENGCEKFIEFPQKLFTK